MTVNNNIENSSIGTFVGRDYNPPIDTGSRSNETPSESRFPSIRMIVGILVTMGAGLAALSNANGAWDLMVKVTHFFW